MSLSLITRKFTVEEYEKMATEGIIKPDEKVVDRIFMLLPILVLKISI